MSGSAAAGWGRGLRTPSRPDAPFLPPQLPGDSAPPAADAHDSDFQQSRPDQHLRSGTSSLVPVRLPAPSSISCHFRPTPSQAEPIFPHDPSMHSAL